MGVSVINTRREQTERICVFVRPLMGGIIVKRLSPRVTPIRVRTVRRALPMRVSLLVPLSIRVRAPRVTAVHSALRRSLLVSPPIRVKMVERAYAVLEVLSVRVQMGALVVPIAVRALRGSFVERLRIPATTTALLLRVLTVLSALLPPRAKRLKHSPSRGDRTVRVNTTGRTSVPAVVIRLSVATE